MASSVVIKVKYEDTLRRFNVSINGEQRFDLNMEGLRLKICSLFNFPSNANFSLTYRDEDNDLVTLVDDEDLHDVVRQGLNPVRITVDLKTNMTAPTPVAASAASSTPRESSPIDSRQKFVPNIPETLNSVPEPLRVAVSKISTELTSKAALASPLLGELMDGLSKMGQSYLNASHSDCGTTNVGGHAEGSAGSKQDSPSEKVDTLINEGIKHNDIKSFSSLFQSPESIQATREAEPKQPSPSNCSSHKSKYANSGFCSHKLSTSKCKKKKEIIDYSAGKSGVNEESIKNLNASMKNHASSKRETSNPNVRSFQFGGNFLGTNPPLGSPIPYNWIPQPFIYKADPMGLVFHKGIRCDGCGVLPITGPRFKSKVKRDYDLCIICFGRMGNNFDYTRLDRPLFGIHALHPKATKGRTTKFCTTKDSTDKPFRPVPVTLEDFPLLEQVNGIRARPRLDSRFIKDVNVLDGTVMAPLTPFTKIWRMRNNGTLSWQHGLKLLWIGGVRFSSSDSVEIELPVNGLNNGEEVDIAVDFVSPELPGQYVSYWRMADPSGHSFGHRVWVSIQVDASVDLTIQSSSNLNLNLLPSTDGALDSQVLDTSEPANVETGDSGFPSMDEQIGDLNFPINDDLLVASDVLCPALAASSSSATSSIRADNGATPEASIVSNPDVAADGIHESPSAPPANLYPVINTSDAPSTSCSTEKNDENNLVQSQGKAAVEETLLKELEDMGFKEVELNKKVLRGNNYDLEQSVDDLCEVSEWDPILEDLQEMGFEDKETNKKLLVKNNGSIMRVVMDLIAGETPQNSN